MTTEIKNVYFENQGDYSARVTLRFLNQGDLPESWYDIWEAFSGAGHPSSGIKDLEGMVNPHDVVPAVAAWLRTGAEFVIEYGAKGVFDRWSFNSPVTSQTFKYGGGECFSVEMHGPVGGAWANTQVG